jgi:hypothetical protein
MVHALVMRPTTQISMEQKHMFVALADLSLPYTWPNVGSVFPYQSNSFQYVWVDGNTYTVTLPQDWYNADTLSAYLQQVMTVNGHYLQSSSTSSPNLYYLSMTSNFAAGNRTVLTCTPVPSSLPATYSIPSGAAPAWSLPSTPKTPQFIIPGMASGNSAPYTFSSLIGVLPDIRRRGHWCLSTR